MKIDKLKQLAKLLTPVIIFMIALLIVLIIIEVVAAVPINGSDNFIKTFDKCESINITINGTLQIDDGEYIIVNNCTGDNNSWLCSCTDNWNFEIMFLPNTINNYSFLFEWSYIDEDESSDGGGTSRKKRTEVVIHEEENETGEIIKDSEPDESINDTFKDTVNDDKDKEIGRTNQDKEVGKTSEENERNNSVSREDSNKTGIQYGDEGVGEDGSIKWWMILLLIIMIIFFFSLFFIKWVFSDKKEPQNIDNELQSVIDKYQK